MIWASTLQIRKHENFGDLDFIILFVGIPVYAINLDVVCLFANSFFVFLAMFVSDVMYSINLSKSSNFTDDRLCYITHEAIFLWYLVPFKQPCYILIILCETTLSLQMKISFFISDKSCHSPTL
jgi:hypothetical protein